MVVGSSAVFASLASGANVGIIVSLVNRTRKPILEVEGDIRRMIGSFGPAGQALDAFGTSIQSSIRFLTQLSVAMTLTGKVVADFDKEIAAIAAISGQSAVGAVDGLRDSAIELSKQFPTSARHVAEGMRFLAQAGLDMNSILEATPSILALSQSTLESFEQSATLVVKTISSMGLEFNQTVHVANALQFAVNQSLNTLESLNNALKFAAPAARTLGISLEDVLSVLIPLSNAGIEAGIAGRSLAQALQQVSKGGQRLTNISAENKKQIGSLAAQINALINSGGTLADITRILEGNLGVLTDTEIATLRATEEMDDSLEGAEERFTGLSTATERLTILVGLFGLRGARVFSQILGESDKLDAFRAALELDVISAANQAGVAMDNLASRTQIAFNQITAGILKSQFGAILNRELEQLTRSGSFTALGISLGAVAETLAKELAPLLPKIVDSISTLADAFAKALPAGISASVLLLEKFANLINALPEPILTALIAFALFNKATGLLSIGVKLLGANMVASAVSASAAGASYGAMQPVIQLLLLQTKLLVAQTELLSQANLRARASTLALTNSLQQEAFAIERNTLAVQKNISAKSGLGKGAKFGGAAVAGTIGVASLFTQFQAAGQEDRGLGEAAFDVGIAAASGAAIGSLIAPGIGTAIGAGVGALAGVAVEVFGRQFGEKSKKKPLVTKEMILESAKHQVEQGGADLGKILADAMVATIQRGGTVDEVLDIAFAGLEKLDVVKKLEDISIGKDGELILKIESDFDLITAFRPGGGFAQLSKIAKEIQGLDVLEPESTNLFGKTTRDTHVRDDLSKRAFVSALFGVSAEIPERFANDFSKELRQVTFRDPAAQKIATDLGIEVSQSEAELLTNSVNTIIDTISKKAEKFRAQGIDIPPDVLSNSIKSLTEPLGLGQFSDLIRSIVEKGGNLDITFEDVDGTMRAIVVEGKDIPTQLRLLSKRFAVQAESVNSGLKNIESANKAVIDAQLSLAEASRATADAVRKTIIAPVDSIRTFADFLINDAELLGLSGKEVFEARSLLSRALLFEQLTSLQTAKESVQIAQQEKNISGIKAKFAASELVTRQAELETAKASIQAATLAIISTFFQIDAQRQLALSQLELADENITTVEELRDGRTRKTVIEGEAGRAPEQAREEINSLRGAIATFDLQLESIAQLFGLTAAEFRKLPETPEGAADLLNRFTQDINKELEAAQEEAKELAEAIGVITTITTESSENIQKVAELLELSADELEGIDIVAFAERLKSTLKGGISLSQIVDALKQAASPLGGALSSLINGISDAGLASESLAVAMEDFRQIEFLTATLGFLQNFQGLANAIGANRNFSKDILAIQAQIFTAGESFLDNLLNITDARTLSELFAKQNFINQNVDQRNTINVQAEINIPEGTTAQDAQKISEIAVQAVSEGLNDALSRNPF